MVRIESGTAHSPLAIANGNFRRSSFKTGNCHKRLEQDRLRRMTTPLGASARTRSSRAQRLALRNRFDALVQLDGAAQAFGANSPSRAISTLEVGALDQSAFHHAVIPTLPCADAMVCLWVNCVDCVEMVFVHTIVATVRISVVQTNPKLGNAFHGSRVLLRLCCTSH